MLFGVDLHHIVCDSDNVMTQREKVGTIVQRGRKSGATNGPMKKNCSTNDYKLEYVLPGILSHKKLTNGKKL